MNDHVKSSKAGRATFSELGPDEALQGSSWAGVTNENTNTFIAKQANQTNRGDGWLCLPWRSMSMPGSMDELDNRRMPLR